MTQSARQIDTRSNGFKKVPLPPDLQRDIPLTDNARTVLRKRYLRRGEDGQPVETEQEMFWRVAYSIAKAEEEFGGAAETVARRFYDLLTTLRFFPNSPTFTGAGTPLGQLAACFVLGIDDDMGRTGSGIFETLRHAALIQQTGGGNGFSFSRLRPKGAIVRSSSGKATGPVGFLRVYDQAFGEIAQGGSRRGANMAVLRVDHPDIREFITCKTSENAITNFNISVGITDAFMHAVETDSDFDLINPQDGAVWETVRARDLFDLIVKQAHHNGEPGVLFLDAANRENPVPELYELESTNPCVTGDTRIATPGGWRRVDEIRVGDEICTVLGTGQVAEIEINHAMPVYAVQFSDGGAVRATAGHQFHVYNPHTGAYEPRRLDRMRVGDAVRVFQPVFAGAVEGPQEGEACVVSIEPAGIATVYDLYEPVSDTWITAGYVSRGCGEQFLGPFENCCLGSINLARHIAAGGRVDWDTLRESIELSTRFLEDVVSANAYVPAVPELKEAAHRVRRIGLGIMGLADMMYMLGVRYGSPEGQEFASQIMEFVRFHAMRTSIDLAKERGPFPAIQGSIYDPANLKWQPPRPLVPHTHDWDRPALDWSEIVAGITQHGIRNGAQLTVAPTGTISTVAGCEGYGCEPVFALAYMRYVNDNGQQLTLQYTSPHFEAALRCAGLDDAAIRRIVEQVNLTGTCQGVEGVPEHIRQVFVVSGDVTAEEHVRMQAAMQSFTDNAISKTVNCPATAAESDVATAYQLAWKLGCKGLTVYVTGSREKVVLETAATKQEKEDAPGEQPRLFNEDKKPRPRFLSGKTYRVQTPLGTTYITINENGEGAGQPFEVFMHTAKAGSETAAVSEALGRLISYVLRITSTVSPRSRLKEIVRQLTGIGGMRPIGFGPGRVSSLPDGLAQVLIEYLNESADAVEGEAGMAAPDRQLALPLGSSRRLGDLCPECGAATLVNEEGCRKCYSCGFSEC